MDGGSSAPPRLERGGKAMGGRWPWGAGTPASSIAPAAAAVTGAVSAQGQGKLQFL